MLHGGCKCPVCFGVEVADHRDLRECRACSHLFQWPPTITAKYDAAYVVKHHLYPMVQSSYSRIGFVKAFCDGGRLLDVGHGIGDFVRASLAAGFDAYGHDCHGVDVGIPTVPDLSGQWDVVTFFDSLEHFADLGPARGLASRATWVIVACPFRPAWFPGERKRLYRHDRPGEHLHYFSERSLRTLFAGHELIRSSDFEDAVRGRRDGEQNIGTWVFRRV